MKLNFDKSAGKNEVLAAVESHLQEQALPVIATDYNRPWGGFFLVDESRAEKFIKTYFPEYSYAELNIAGKLSPKILVVAPGKRLSWQYHGRRAELWKLIGGEAALMTSDDDEESEMNRMETGAIVHLRQGVRHRLIGAEESWGIVAEIWQHTERDNPSDEDDIIRLQDDFGR